MIECKNIRRVFGKGDSEVRALDGVSLTVPDGKMLAVIGPSGSGKSTLLNILGCLDRPTSGEYRIDGREVGTCTEAERAALRNEKFGFVVQDFALIPDYTVLQNVLLPVRYGKFPMAQKREEAKALLDRLGIGQKAGVYPTKLSGGQKQRVAIARALIGDPQILLADEPTGALDRKTGQEIIDLFCEINRAGKTVIVITHDRDVAARCDSVIELCDGKIL